MTKVLTAYFSRAGENYFNGNIEAVEKGNTEVCAETIQKLTGCDLFRIETVNGYSDQYKACTEEAKKEKENHALPALKDDKDIADYDTIILCYPNWWGTMPMGVFTFLESHDFAGKNVLPLCTHEGSRLGMSTTDLRKKIPDAKIRCGLAVQGSNVYEAEETIEEWLKEEGVL